MSQDDEIFDFDFEQEDITNGTITRIDDPTSIDIPTNLPHGRDNDNKNNNNSNNNAMHSIDISRPASVLVSDEYALKIIRDIDQHEGHQHQREAEQEGEYGGYRNELLEEAIVIDEEDEEQYDKFIPNTQEEINLKKLTKGESLIPPENFSQICGEIYRSSFPRIENFEFLTKNLKLKTILCLIPEDYPQENIKFNEENDIQLFQIGLSGNKEPFVKIKPALVTKSLEIILNPANHPILIHCNRGKHRTGCIVGCIRKLQKWSNSMIFDEYRRFAYPKERPLDQQFIEMYDDFNIYEMAVQNKWIPLKW